MTPRSRRSSSLLPYRHRLSRYTRCETAKTEWSSTEPRLVLPRARTQLVEQDSEAVRAVLVVADPFRDEVERCRHDQGNPWRLVDDVAVDLLPESGSQTRPVDAPPKRLSAAPPATSASSHARAATCTRRGLLIRRRTNLVHARPVSHYRDVRPRRVSREDDEPAGATRRVSAAVSGREAGQVSAGQRPLAAPVPQHRPPEMT
jgi:hypothetical protein